MQCKDIPTKPILEYVARYGGIGCNWFEISEDIEGKNDHWRSVRNAMPTNTPDKLVFAKMKHLIHKGLIDGCDCGCRGDYKITEKGLIRITELD